MSRSNNETGIAHDTVQCPDCDYVFRISWQQGVRRFRPKKHRCPDCGYASTRAGFEDPTWESDA